MISTSFLSMLACPRDNLPLEQVGEELVCQTGHRFPVVEGIPVLLRDDVSQTLWVAGASLKMAQSFVKGNRNPSDPFFIHTLGLTREERDRLFAQMMAYNGEGLDPVISFMVSATSGYLYESLRGEKFTLPIPELRLPNATDELLLELGCNWGRWCVAAARKGYTVIGIDPSLGAVLAAQRLCETLGITNASFIVADARYIPLRSELVNTVFSYSVIQHLSKQDARQVLSETRRVLETGGFSFIQMPNQYGIRALYHQARRRFAEPQAFDVRYWQPRELVDTFSSLIGPSSLTVDGYFGLGIQPSDKPVLSKTSGVIIDASETLRRLSVKVPVLVPLADSLYVNSQKGT